MEYKLGDLEERYELELPRIIETIQEAAGGRLQAAGKFRVLLQLPDGLKPWGLVLSDYIEREIRSLKLDFRVEVVIWLGDCFGACDLPDSGCDLVVQFGHAAW